ncbi:uncharacterized protein LOC128740601 [Sabethes cyaneus]|uniref:uncharacterized protein LOC128740601 n=1 Tax=Sabethes cyaneus TaxID=53552 RepID=UPI00237E5DEC|nr:uncharacterized protein LOC128740601 [Sabethes cyaneus]
MWRESDDYPVTYGLVQFGRDCGFGEHSVATGFANHLDWMKSVLLPNHTETNGAPQFLDDALREGDRCISDDNYRREGRCVAASKCPRKWKQFLSTGKVQFCSSSTVICCPLDDIGSVPHIHPDIASCPDVVRNIRSKKSGGSLVHIAWVQYRNLQYRCMGSILTGNLVLTSASCLGEVKPDVVRPFSDKINYLFRVSASLRHQAYNTIDNSNDIGLVGLIDSFLWSPDVYPSCLWTNSTHTPLVLDMVFPSRTANSDYKQVLAMYNSDCQRTNGYQLPESQLCVRNSFENHTCVGLPSVLYWKRSDGVEYVVGLSTLTYSGLEMSFDSERGQWNSIS